MTIMDLCTPNLSVKILVENTETDPKLRINVSVDGVIAPEIIRDFEYDIDDTVKIHALYTAHS